MCCIAGQGQLPVKHEALACTQVIEVKQGAAAAISVCYFLYIAAVAKEQLSCLLESLAGLRVFLILITAGRACSSQARAGAASQMSKKHVQEYTAVASVSACE